MHSSLMLYHLSHHFTSAMKTCIDYSQGLPAAAGAAGLIPLLSLVLGEGQPDGDGDDDETNDATRGTYEQNNF